MLRTRIGRTGGGSGMEMTQARRAGQAPEVTIVPATKLSLQNNALLKDRARVRVAAYCRVSTDDESQ